MALKSIYIADLQRDNSCQSDSSGFLEEPFIPLSLQAPQPQDISDDSIDSQATLQESRTCSILGQDTEHKTDCFAKSSIDNNCTLSLGTHLVLHIFPEENKSYIENDNEDNPGEESVVETSGFLDGSSRIDTSQSLAPDNSSHLNTQVQVQSNDSQSQNEYPAMIKGRTPATENYTISGSPEATQRLPECVSCSSNFMTVQITQDMDQQKCSTKVDSLESLTVSYQHVNKATTPESESIFVGSRKRKTREVSVQTDEEYPVERNQSPNKHSSFKSEFQFGKSFRKSLSLDTGLHHLNSDLQEHSQTAATHCCCHHCCCAHHHCSSSWHKGTKDSSKVGTSHLEGYRLNTLEELQQAVKIISAYPLAIQEIVTTKQFLQHFQNQLLDIEKCITEQQALVYSVLSEDEREEVKRLQKLRQAVYNEITELGVQLEDRARQVEEEMSMQLQSLLKEQSTFYSSLEKPKKVSGMTSVSHTESSPSVCNSTASLRPDFTSASLIPSEEPDSSAASGHKRVNSLSPSMAQKASIEINTTAKPNVESSSSQLKATKQNNQPGAVDIRTILQNIFALILTPIIERPSKQWEWNLRGFLGVVKKPD
ncbi:protein ITPRID1-like [Callorhinchus milii]|uniref:protein ITPRID1-like n=1 Tax=Callorhinchus milii TaxID=7868 RepID=UPI001C3F6C39|nr:protein ITPRID1-like [Callorhinchus milii]